MEIFHYHHLDPRTKTREISVIGWAWKSVKAYVENGVVQLCPTCHSVRHFLEREKRRNGLKATVRGGQLVNVEKLVY